MRQSRVPFNAGQFIARRLRFGTVRKQKSECQEDLFVHEWRFEWNFPHDNLQQNISVVIRFPLAHFPHTGVFKLHRRLSSSSS